VGQRGGVADAEWLTRSQRRWVWVAEDVRDAFLHVPVPRLLQIAQKYLPDERLMGLLSVVLPAQKLPGVRQGGPASPLALNLYLHDRLDYPWCQDQPRWPLIRVADDLLVLCRTARQARQAYAELHGRLQSAGMALKGTVETAVSDLAAGDSADWLGFVVRRRRGTLTVEIAE